MAPAIAERRLAPSRTSPFESSAPREINADRSPALRPPCEWQTPTTLLPCASAHSAKCAPKNPLTPVTTSCLRVQTGRADHCAALAIVWSCSLSVLSCPKAALIRDPVRRSWESMFMTLAEEGTLALRSKWRARSQCLHRDSGKSDTFRFAPCHAKSNGANRLN